MAGPNKAMSWAEYGAVVLRTHGGFHGEFGPINCFVHPFGHCQKPSVFASCDAMFSKVQDFVSKNPSICEAVK